MIEDVPEVIVRESTRPPQQMSRTRVAAGR
jgi:hypothetical protein